MAQHLELPRRLGAGSATIPLALGGMLGAGLFVGVAPASAAAGVWLLLGIPIAAATAACCAFSTADQSDVYRGPGAAYACARSRLGVVPARIAASTNLAGQLAAMGAVAGAVGDYLAPAGAGVKPLVILLVVAAATAGLRIRGAAAWLWLAITVIVLAVVFFTCFTIAPAPPPPAAATHYGNAFGITGAAGVMFFAFSGFERLTAPAEERDRHERRHIRRSLIVSLVTATVVYLGVAAALLYQLGSARLALSPVPITDALDSAAATNLKPLIGVGIAVALLPVLLGALESARSTGLAVVRDGDLPRALGRTGGNGTPYLLDLACGLVAAALSVLLQPAQAITLAACCLLVHYAFSNAGARLLLAEDRTWPMRTACLGMGLSVMLAMSMPVPTMIGTLAVVLAGPVLCGVVSGRWS